MSNKVLLKKSSVVDKVPTASDLDYGELALNYADGKLYYKTSTNLISSFSSASFAGVSSLIAGNAINLSSTTGDVTVSHADTSSASSLTASGRTYVTGLTFDTFGHVTGFTTGTETVVDTNTTYSAGTGISLSGTTFSVGAGDGLTQEVTGLAVNSTVVRTTGDQTIAGTKTFSGAIAISASTGNITFANSGTTKRGIIGNVGDSDQWFIGGGATVSNAGFLEIATGDDAGTEPILVRQYQGNAGFGTITRTLTLLDGSGNTTFPGSISAVTKSFLINHPTKPGMKLRHGSLEGPEHGVYIRGKIKGTVIELPEYWTKLVDADSITVQLTAIGKGQKLYVEDIRNNKVYIANDGVFTSEPNCFYLIQAERVDIEKMGVELNNDY